MNILNILRIQNLVIHDARNSKSNKNTSFMFFFFFYNKFRLIPITILSFV